MINSLSYFLFSGFALSLTEGLAVLFFLSLPAVIWLSILYKQQKVKNRDLRKYEKSHKFDELELLQSLINNMPDLIYIKNINSKFLITNDIHASLLGLDSPAKMIGKTDFDLHPRELANSYFWSEKELMTSKKPVISREEEVMDHEGNKMYLSTTKFPLIDSKGECYGLVGIGRDITDRKKAEFQLLEHAEELQQTNTLLEEKQEEILQQTEELKAQTDILNVTNLELERVSLVARETDNVVLILDAAGNVEWANESFTRVYGASLEEFVSKHGSSLLESSFNPNIKEIYNRCRETGESVRYESKTTDKNGAGIWFQSNLTPVLNANKEIIRFIAIDSDVTALKNAQAMISNHKEEIEAQRDQLQKLNNTKDKFLSIIAHDLRNPFHSILGFSELLARNADGIEEEKRKSYIELIHESALYAHDLLENLLQWSRSQTDRIKYSPALIDLHAVINEVQHISMASLEKKNLSFTSAVNIDTIVYSDKNMLSAIIRNLLNNAIKFTPEKGKISITLEDMGVQYIVSVTDSGIGIKKEDIDKILNREEFHTTAGTSGEAGTGIGLIIVSDFVKRLGGTLSIDSEQGKGSTFSFTLAKNKS